jgi:DNA-binding NarL/FixJ family response regulator
VRLVIADDQDVVRMGLRVLLERQPDMEVVAEAASGAEAVIAIAEERPDIALLDLEMKGGRGFETLAAAVRTSETTKVVVFSVHDQAFVALRALRVGARGYVIKSARAERLLLALRSVSDGHPWVDPAIEPMALDRILGEGSEALALSPREAEVLRLTSRGFTTRAIASKLGLGAKSVETFRSRGYNKLGLRNASELGLFARIENWL